MTAGGFRAELRIGIIEHVGAIAFTPFETRELVAKNPRELYLENILEYKIIERAIREAVKEAETRVLEIVARMGVGKTYFLIDELAKFMTKGEFLGKKRKAVMVLGPSRQSIIEIARGVNARIKSMGGKAWKGFVFISPAANCPIGRQLAVDPYDLLVCEKCKLRESSENKRFYGFRTFFPVAKSRKYNNCEKELAYKSLYMLATGGWHKYMYGHSVAAFLMTHQFIMHQFELILRWEDYERRGVLENKKWVLVVEEYDSLMIEPMVSATVPPKSMLGHELDDDVVGDAYRIVVEELGGQAGFDKPLEMPLLYVGARLHESGLTPEKFARRCKTIERSEGVCRLAELTKILWPAFLLAKELGVTDTSSIGDIPLNLIDKLFERIFNRTGSRLSYSKVVVYRDEDDNIVADIFMSRLVRDLLFDPRWPTSLKLLLSGTPAARIEYDDDERPLKAAAIWYFPGLDQVVGVRLDHSVGRLTYEKDAAIERPSYEELFLRMYGRRAVEAIVELARRGYVDIPALGKILIITSTKRGAGTVAGFLGVLGIECGRVGYGYKCTSDDIELSIAYLGPTLRGTNIFKDYKGAVVFAPSPHRGRSFSWLASSIIQGIFRVVRSPFKRSYVIYPKIVEVVMRRILRGTPYDRIFTPLYTLPLG